MDSDDGLDMLLDLLENDDDGSHDKPTAENEADQLDAGKEEA